MNKFTEKAQEAIVGAQRIAEQNNNGEIDVEHLLLALLNEPEGIASAVVQRLGAGPAQLRTEVTQDVQRRAKVYGQGQVYASPRFRKCLEIAEAEAERLKDDYVSTEHLLIAMTDHQINGAVGRILQSKGVTRDRIYQALTQIRGSQRVTSQNPESTYQSLEKYRSEERRVGKECRSRWSPYH